MATDYISREEAKNKFFAGNGFIYYGADVISRIEEIPPANVVEVVRCKDCLHRCRNGTCEIAPAPAFAYMSDTDFCSKGKRK